MISVKEAIKAIEGRLGWLKLCEIEENDTSYILSVCGPNGEYLCGTYPYRVDKETGNVGVFFHTDKDFFEPRTKVQFPEEYRHFFAELKSWHEE